MARIRTIKPEFWRNEELSSVSAEAALLAIGLLNHADDEGCFNSNPKLVESDVFPLRELSVTVPLLLQELANIGFVELFTGTNGKKYGLVVKFLKHQKISKPSPSKIKTYYKLQEDSVNAPVILPVGKEQGTGKGTGKGTGNREQGKEQGKDTSTVELRATSTAKCDISEIFDFWRFTMQHAKAQLDNSRRKLIGDALKMGYSVPDLKLAVSGCSMSEWHMGKNDRSTRYDSLQVILKSADKVDKFIGIHNQGGARAGRGAELDNISNQAIHEWLGEASVIDISEAQHG